MSALEARFDAELWRWDARSVRPVGPAGIAVAEFGDLRAHVDAYDGRLVGVTVDAEGPDGRLASDASGLLHWLLDGAVADGAALVPVPRSEEVLARLAVLACEWNRQRSLGPSSPAWEAEAAALRAELPELELEPRLAEGIEPEDEATTTLVAAARSQFLRTPGELGRLVEEGGVMVDSSWVLPGLLDLRSLRSTVERSNDRVVIETGVQPGIYPVSVHRIHAALLDEQTNLIVAVAPFEVGTVAGGPGARAELTIHRSRPLETVSLWLTGDLSCPPSSRLRATRVANDLGRRAAQARRLGLPAAASDLLERSMQRWRDLGHEPQVAEPVEMLRYPFLGELRDLTDTSIG